jgi:hypothetical protein
MTSGFGNALRSQQTLTASADLFHRVSGRTAVVLTATQALTQSALSTRGLGLAHLLAGLAGTAGAILKVAAHPAWVDESYMLGRAFLERSINAAYLAVCEDEAYSGFVEHALARRYRDEDRSVTLSGRTTTIKRIRPPGTTPPEIDAAIARFTSRKGRTLDWTKLSLEQRASTVAEAVPSVQEVLALAILGIYGKGSEALHGTMFGLTIFPAPGRVDSSGEQEDTRDSFDWSERIEGLVGLFIALARTAEVLLRVLAARGQHDAITTLASDAEDDVRHFFTTLRAIAKDNASP